VNAALPPDIRSVALDEASPEFHARFTARSKTYRYLIRNGPLVSPFERACVWHVPEPLDVAAMQAAAAMLVGTHDFAAFRSTGTGTKNTVRTIAVSAVNLWRGPTLLAYTVTGDGFLRHMVRAIVGTLVEIGRGRRPAASMTTLLTGRSRAEAGATAPPHGLFLVRVDYD
jgi:tRNA pseudouridine38-40 synthase